MQGHCRDYLTLKVKELRSVEVYATVYPNSVSSLKSWILRRKGFFVVKSFMDRVTSIVLVNIFLTVYKHRFYITGS